MKDKKLKKSNGKPNTVFVVLIFAFTFLILIAVALILRFSLFNNKAYITNGKIHLKEINVDFASNDVSGDKKTNILTEAPSEQDVINGTVYDTYWLNLEEKYTEPISVSFPIPSDYTFSDDESLSLVLCTSIQDSNGSESYREINIKSTIDKESNTISASFSPKEFYDNITEVHMTNSSPAPSGLVSAHTYNKGIGIKVSYSNFYFDKGGHFKLYLPKSYYKKDGFFSSGKWEDVTAYWPDEEKTALLQDCEYAYNLYLEKGYKYEVTEPIDVYIKDISGGGDGLYDGLYSTIYLNLRFFKQEKAGTLINVGIYDSKRIKPIIVHEFFHHVQSFYVGLLGGDIWFDEAASTYFELKESGELCSDTTMALKEHPFEFLFPKENDQWEGYAREPLFRFISKKIGEDWIRTAYEKKDFSYETLINLPGDPKVWVPEFHIESAMGQIGCFYSTASFFSVITSAAYPTFSTHIKCNLPAADEIASISTKDGEVILAEKDVSINGYGCHYIALDIVNNSGKNNTATNMIASVKWEGNFAVNSIYSVNSAVWEPCGTSLKNLPVGKGESRKYIICVTSLSELESTESGKIKIVLEDPYPKLQEIEGTYEFAMMEIKDAFISERLMAEAQNETVKAYDENGGCDPLLVVAYAKENIGMTQIFPFQIIANDDTTGTFVVISEDKNVPYDFTYSQGHIIFSGNTDGTEVAGDIECSYWPDETYVHLEGNLHFTFAEYSPDELYMDVQIRDSKEIEPYAP